MVAQAIPHHTAGTAVDFVTAELSLGMQFCEVALNTHNPARKFHHLQDAEAACDSALEFADRLEFTDDERMAILQQCDNLRSTLAALREEPRRLAAAAFSGSPALQLFF